MFIAIIIWMCLDIMEDWWALRHKIQDLIDEGVIIIDLLNQKYEISDRPKDHYASHPDPPANSFIIGNLGPNNLQTEDLWNEHPHRPHEPEERKTKFKPASS